MLVSAIYLLNKRGHKIKLVITGPGTQGIKGLATYFGLEQRDDFWDVIGLGYIKNEEIDSLIECAQIVVNSSLYEAGNGSGIDAWKKGIPVAMSNIPSFVEHIKIQGVHAELFDPRNAHDIANKLENILLKYSLQKKLAIESSINIRKFTNWEIVATQYYELFKRTIEEK